MTQKASQLPVDRWEENEDGGCLTRGCVRTRFVSLGEGFSGDFNPCDPEDENLLRFDVEYDPDGEGDFCLVDRGSACTWLPVAAPERIRRAALLHLLDAVYQKVVDYASIKSACEEHSYMEPAWFDGSKPQPTGLAAGAA